MGARSVPTTTGTPHVGHPRAELPGHKETVGAGGRRGREEGKEGRGEAGTGSSFSLG